MPSAQRRFAHTFDDGVFGGVGIVVVLLEENELDANEVRKGYEVFVRELENVVGGFIEANDRQPTEDEMAELVGKIQQRVERAIRSALTRWEKLGVALSVVSPDKPMGYATELTPVLATRPSRPFILTLQSKFTVRDPILQPSGAPPILGPPREVVQGHFELDGSIELRDPPPVITVPVTPPVMRVPPRNDPPRPPRPRSRPPGTHEP